MSEQCPYAQPAILVASWLHCVLKEGHKGSHRSDWNHRQWKMAGARWTLKHEIDLPHERFTVACDFQGKPF